jgi:hypothetical protein
MNKVNKVDITSKITGISYQNRSDPQQQGETLIMKRAFILLRAIVLLSLLAGLTATVPMQPAFASAPSQADGKGVSPENISTPMGRLISMEVSAARSTLKAGTFP